MEKMELRKDTLNHPSSFTSSFFLSLEDEYSLSLGLRIVAYFQVTDRSVSFGLHFLLGPKFSLGYGYDGLLLGINSMAILFIILFSIVKTDSTQF